MASLSTRKAKDGSLLWHIRYTYQGCERTRSLGRVRKEDAKREQIRVGQCLADGKDPDLTSPLRLAKQKPNPVEQPQIVTLQDALAMFDKCKSANGRNQPSTLKSRRRCFSTISTAMLGKPLTEVSKLDLEKWFIDYGQTRAPGTVNMANSYIKSVFNWCVEFDLLAKSPMRGISKAPIERNPIKTLSEEQANQLLETAQGNFYRAVFIALNFGMRSGEIIRLTWEDVDEVDESIRVVAKKNKTHKARVVPAPGSEVMKEILSWKSLDSLPTDQVVPYNSNYYVSRRFREIKRAKGWPEGLTFHSTRHTYITRLQTGGVQIALVSRLAGHSSVQVTDKYYTHFAPDDLKQAASRLNYNRGRKSAEGSQEVVVTEAA